MRLIGLVGKKQSGKDTVFSFIKKHSKEPSLRIAFADALKEDIAEFCRVSIEDIEKHKDQFRLMLQGYGTDFKRKRNPNYWVDEWQRRVVEHCQEYPIIVATDVRFLNEAERIRAMSGELWRVVNQRHHAMDMHQSETELEFIKCDHVIFNNGTLDELQEKVIKLL